MPDIGYYTLPVILSIEGIDKAVNSETRRGWCGKYVQETEYGRARRWCSDACRMKSYRAHRRAKLG